MPSTCRSGDDAEQWPDGKLEACPEPRLQLFPAPCVHADFAAPSAFAVADQQRSAALVEIGFAERKRFLDAQAGSPEDHDQSSQPLAVRAIAAAPITAMISSTLGGSAG